MGADGYGGCGGGRGCLAQSLLPSPCALLRLRRRLRRRLEHRGGRRLLGARHRRAPHRLRRTGLLRRCLTKLDLTLLETRDPLLRCHLTVGNGRSPSQAGDRHRRRGSEVRGGGGERGVVCGATGGVQAAGCAAPRVATPPCAPQTLPAQNPVRLSRMRKARAGPTSASGAAATRSGSAGSSSSAAASVATAGRPAAPPCLLVQGDASS